MKQKTYLPEGQKYLTLRFVASVVFLVLTFFIIFLLLSFYFEMNHAITPDKAEDLGDAIGATFLTLTGVFVIFLAFVSAFMTSFIGFCVGYSSVKRLPTKRMTIWAKIVSFTNLGICVISLVHIIYYISVLFFLFYHPDRLKICRG